jgi:hypothetical protein
MESGCDSISLFSLTGAPLHSPPKRVGCRCFLRVPIIFLRYSLYSAVYSLQLFSSIAGGVVGVLGLAGYVMRLVEKIDYFTG